MAFLSEKELKSFGFKYVGKNVLVSEKASIFNPANISIDDHARIDDFCILSAGKGGIKIGKYVHIGCHSSLIGQGAIVLEDFSGISGRVSIYSSNEDYSGNFLTNPTIPAQYANRQHGNVTLKRHAIIGAGSIILPNVEIGIGAAVGALSLVRENCKEFGIYVGNPAKWVKWRSRNLLKLEQEFLHTQEHK